MTQRVDVAIGRAIIVRWRILAEKRLAYLIDLYETRRWPRYYTDQAFLDDLRATKAAVAAWTALAPPPEGTAAVPPEVRLPPIATDRPAHLAQPSGAGGDVRIVQKSGDRQSTPALTASRLPPPAFLLPNGIPAQRDLRQP